MCPAGSSGTGAISVTSAPESAHIVRREARAARGLDGLGDVQNRDRSIRAQSLAAAVDGSVQQNVADDDDERSVAGSAHPVSSASSSTSGRRRRGALSTCGGPLAPWVNASSTAAQSAWIATR